MLEPHGELIDDLAETMDADEAAAFTLDGAGRIGDFPAGLAARYDWALAHDYAAPEDTTRFWYVSKEKLEPGSENALPKTVLPANSRSASGKWRRIWPAPWPASLL